MNEIVERYGRRADKFEGYVAAVRPDQWGNQSPCEEWKARDVVGHIVMMHDVMLRPLGRELSPAPSVEDDPLAAFRSARADVAAVLADPTLAKQEVPTPMGPMILEDHIDQVVSADMVLHGWDLARATGQDETMDPVEVEVAWAGLSSFPDDSILRQPGVFGPRVEVPEDASTQDKLLGFIGRNP